MDDRTPLACRLDALTAAERERHRGLTHDLARAIRKVWELPRGWSFRFAEDSALDDLLVEWMALESRCCPFLEFELDFSRSERAAVLRLTGRDGVKEFLAHDIEPFFVLAPPRGPELPARRPTEW